MNEFRTLTVALSDDGIGRLTLAQPDKLNPLGSLTLRELIGSAAWFDERDALVVVVSGQGRAFSAGFDLREFAEDTGDVAATADLGRQMAEAVEAMEAVTIAAVHGHCVGGGVVLAAACDLRIAAEGTRFSIPEVDLGIPLGWGGVPRLVREIGPGMTRELVLTCRPFDADEAHALGLVNRVVPVERLDDEVTILAGELALKAPSVLRTTLGQVREAAEALASTEGAVRDAALLARALADPGARRAAERYLSDRG